MHVRRAFIYVPSSPDALLASKKRSSSNSTAASGSGGRGVARGRYDDPDGAAGSNSGGSSRGGGRGGGRAPSDRSSSGSVASADSGKSVWSVYSDGEEGTWTGIQWDNLNSYTVRVTCVPGVFSSRGADAGDFSFLLSCRCVDPRLLGV